MDINQAAKILFDIEESRRPKPYPWEKLGLSSRSVYQDWAVDLLWDYEVVYEDIQEAGLLSEWEEAKQRYAANNSSALPWELIGRTALKSYFPSVFDPYKERWNDRYDHGN